MASDVLATLKAMRELLSDPARWTQFPCPNRWTLFGAFDKCARGLSEADHEAVYEALVAQIPQPEIELLSCFNEESGRTHAEVLALLDRAIAGEEGRS